jgi:hypothetical protein
MDEDAQHHYNDLNWTQFAMAMDSVQDRFEVRISSLCVHLSTQFFYYHNQFQWWADLFLVHQQSQECKEEL